MELCLIGKVTKAIGINGGVRIESYSDIPGRFAGLNSVFLGEHPSGVHQMNVTRVVEQQKKIVLYFQDIIDRNQAEELRGMCVYIPSDQMMAPPVGMYFVHDLIGCEVLTSDAIRKGRLTDVLPLASHDIYVVDADGREVMIPAVPEFVVSVDVDQKRILVHEIPGLFDDAD